MRRLIFIVSFILVSFAVGVKIGLSRNGVSAAHAGSYSSSEQFVNVYAIEELNITPVGAGGEINSKTSGVYSFSSPSSVDELTTLQEKRWKQVGLLTSGKVSPQRGVVLGINKEGREMYQLVAFFCPPAIRDRICNGQNTFGMISKLTDEGSSKAASLPFKVCIGGKELSSYSASDLGHPSITATYFCPSSVETVRGELDSEFLTWQKREDTPSILVYSRDAEEVTAIPSGKDGKTLVVVTYQRGV